MFTKAISWLFKSWGLRVPESKFGVLLLMVIGLFYTTLSFSGTLFNLLFYWNKPEKGMILPLSINISFFGLMIWVWSFGDMIPKDYYFFQLMLFVIFVFIKMTMSLYKDLIDMWIEEK
jgi:hypothetical protein